MKRLPKETKTVVPVKDESTRIWSRRDKKFVQLADKLSDFIVERKERSEREPPSLKVNAGKPPILVLVLEGIVSTPWQVDELIENEIMDKHVRDNMAYFENNMKVVIDLRGLKDIYFYAFEAIAYRWAPYLNVRAERVVLVLPHQKGVLEQLRANSVEVQLEQMMPDVTWAIVYRSRDVHGALN